MTREYQHGLRNLHGNLIFTKITFHPRKRIWSGVYSPFQQISHRCLTAMGMVWESLHKWFILRLVLCLPCTWIDSFDSQHLQDHGSDPASRKESDCASSCFRSTVAHVLQNPIDWMEYEAPKINSQCNGDTPRLFQQQALFLQRSETRV